MKLRHYADDVYEKSRKEDDLKIYLKKQELIEIIGSKSYEEMEAMFGSPIS